MIAQTPAAHVVNVGSMNMLIQRPAGTAKGVVILVPGDNTDLRIDANGFVGNRVSFDVRARKYFLQDGYATILLSNTNLIPQAIAQTASLAGPVFLVGTANGGGPILDYYFKKPDPRVAGLVFAPAVTEPGPVGDYVITNYQLRKITLPVLLVQNRQDQCPTTLANNAYQLPAMFAKATLQWQNSFQAAGPACGGLSPHGFLGIEQQTVGGIVQWMGSAAK